MVGGRIIEVIKLEEKIWINTVSRTDLDDRCAIYVERTAESEKVKPNDKLWWQGSIAYWTAMENGEIRGRIEVELKKVSGSGVPRPSIEATSGQEVRDADSGNGI